VTIDRRHGSDHLEQYVIRFAPGRSEPRSLSGRQELLYVASGVGTLHVGETEHALEPGTGVYVVSGETYEVENPGPAELVVVAVAAPQESGRAVAPERRTVRYADQPALKAGPDREFRYLVNQDVGCLDVTQFVGVIPPGRAPMHSHSYDEIVYVIDGEGTLHLGGRETPIGPGSAMHLPPLAEHCLENTGKGSMKVLGVFHPSGDPASRATESE
jgi:mannose-6-phosphate isomerase-like protein (cupin superfamily)